MKKLIISVLIVTLLLVCIPVMAAKVNINNLLINSNNVGPDGSLNTKENLTEVRYQAENLHFEWRNNNNEIISSGNLGNLIKSTPLFILDMYDNHSYIPMPFGTYFVIYPEGKLVLLLKKSNVLYLL